MNPEQANAKAKEVIEAIKRRKGFDAAWGECDVETRVAILHEVTGILMSADVKESEQEGKPVGPATIVQDTTPIENFPSHAESVE